MEGLASSEDNLENLKQTLSHESEKAWPVIQMKGIGPLCCFFLLYKTVLTFRVCGRNPEV